MTPNLVNVSGLVFDLFGAGLIVMALAFAKAKIVKAQSLTVMDANPVTHLAMLRQRQDALFGLLFLAIGFALQIVAALGLFWRMACWYVPSSALLLGLLAYGVMRWRLNHSTVAERAARMLQLNAAHLGAE